MKIGVVSDVHNNVEALQYALDHLAGCDLLLNLGDLISESRVEPAILRLAESAGLLGIRGNHEKTLLFHPGARLRDKLPPQDRAYLEALPSERLLHVAGCTVHVAHGAPWDEPNDYRCTYVMPRDVPREPRLGETGATVLLLGHTHVPMIERAGGTLIVNPGSCGERRMGFGLSFGVLDFNAGLAEVCEIRLGEPPAPLLTSPLAG
ncbi:MAG: metallophosphoesterase family protein [Chloroflexi bacterium]|nr:metallophosphoesterase family protein [Chloroflexota bacterium]